MDEQFELALDAPEEKTPTNEIVRKYLKLRNQIAALEKKHEEELEPLEAAFNNASAELLEVCNQQNADSIRTPEGTVSRRVQSRYWTSDWPRMYEFIKNNDAPFLLEQRIHNTNMKQFLSDHPDDLPIGLQADRKYVVQVRKPSSNKETL